MVSFLPDDDSLDWRMQRISETGGFCNKKRIVLTELLFLYTNETPGMRRGVLR
jgi:hypothetical protein